MSTTSLKMISCMAKRVHAGAAMDAVVLARAALEARHRMEPGTT
jgi:hypothetical protein